MADCSKTVDFLRELNRMHEAFDECRNCPLSGWKREPSGPGCIEFIKHHTAQTIAIVQKWSDEHPVLTWAGKLRELLPGAKEEALEIIKYSFCPSDIFGFGGDGDCTPVEQCKACWNGEYKEAET